jgi:hypothetical protein
LKDKIEKTSKNENKDFKESISKELTELAAGVKVLPKTSPK